MKKILITMVIAIMMAILPAQAQFGFGLRGGVNLTSLSLSKEVLSSSNRAGFFVGPTVKYTFPILGLGVDLSAVYDQRNSGVMGETVIEKNIFVPINLHYQLGLGSMASLFIKAGPQFGWNVGGKNYQFNFSKDNIEAIRGDFKLKNSNMSLNVGLGALLFKHLELGITYNIALGKTGEVSYWDAAKAAAGEVVDVVKHGSTRTNAWQLNLAYYF